MKNKISKPIFENLPFAYALHKVILDDHGTPIDYTYLDVNHAFESFTGLKKESIIGKNVTEVMPNIKSSQFNWISYYGNIAINMQESEFEQYFEELQRWYKVKAFSPNAGFFITYFVDITNELREKNLYKSILSSLEEGILATDSHGNITMMNYPAQLLTGLITQKVLNHNIFEVMSSSNSSLPSLFREDVSHVLNTATIIKDQEIDIEYSEHLNRSNIHIVYSIYPIKSQNNDLEGIVVRFQDITDKKEKQRKIEYITNHDSLTGVYNRTFFNDQIKLFNKEENLPISIIMGDVNGLKLTNDAFGHLLGDKLLTKAAEVMKNSCRDQDLVIRWGGDEFIILLPNTDEKQVEIISNRIKFNSEIEKIDSINLSISLGYATKYRIFEDIINTINASEDMMYRVKMIESKSQKNKTLMVITKTLQEKSRLDAEHSKNVSKLCIIVGELLELSSKEVSELEILGDIHDIGKVAISESLLNKKSSLNSEEWCEVKKHSEIGYHIALSSPDLSFLADAVLAHHEKYNGTGYPKGLEGNDIPFYARVLCVADALDSMMGYRPYKDKKNWEEAVTELKRCSGQHFDPIIVNLFVDKVVPIIKSTGLYS